MIWIDDVLVEDDVVEARFVCNLQACKGGCCVDGDAGAPLEAQEAEQIRQAYATVKNYLPEDHRACIEQKGHVVHDPEFGMVTPLLPNGMCAYAIVENGIVKCAFEKAFHDGKTSFHKPVSCHLYPLRVRKIAHHTAVLYEPRENLCRPACELGKKLGVPVFRFVKQALIRKFGEEFYQALEQIAEKYFQRNRH
ncbi:DUF3109 family protein [Thermoflavifilum thermophilum]|uniref:DUF3109 family protein n=1 Tax=Thermoflavifilum thermophilum TaxID=1393122 RepID=A0A1I7NAW0_9BACT|nr:DUF3109 family protein [Thermoflavifilum thermophilum]SFV31822.1 Protein of unknown function [Thermoflavifilum thermophilum]